MSISKSQSFISHTGKAIPYLGSCETPVPCIGESPMNRFALAHRYPVLRYSTFLRLGGLGYRSCSRAPGSGSATSDVVNSGLWIQLNFPTNSSCSHFLLQLIGGRNQSTSFAQKVSSRSSSGRCRNIRPYEAGWGSG